MNDLNSVPKTGTFGSAVDEINSNFELLETAISQLESRTSKFAGFFQDATALQATVPSPTVGMWADVGSTKIIYRCVTAGTWTETEETDSISTSVSYDVVNNLTSTSTTKALSAKQGKVLNDTLASLKAAGYAFAGVASPSSSISTPSENVFYIGGAGTYTNFGSSYTVKNGEIGIFLYNGTWQRYSVTTGIGQSPYIAISSDNIQMLPGFVASSNNQQYQAGTLVEFEDFAKSGGYMVSPVISLLKGTYYITSNTSASAATVVQCDSNGDYVSTLAVGTSASANARRKFTFSQTTYIRVSSKTTLPINIERITIESPIGIATIDGYVASANNAQYAEGTLVTTEVTGSSTTYEVTELIKLSAGRYYISACASYGAAMVAEFDSEGNYIGTINAFRGTQNPAELYKIEYIFTTDKYIRISSKQSRGFIIEQLTPDTIDGVRVSEGYIASANNQSYSEGTLVNITVVGYRVTNLIELPAGKYSIKASASSGAAMIAEFDKFGNYVRTLVVGTGVTTQQKFDITISQNTYIRICSRESVAMSIENLIDDVATKDSINTVTSGGAFKIAELDKKMGAAYELMTAIKWNNGYIASANHPSAQEGSIQTATNYKYSDIITLQGGVTYRIGLGATKNAIVLSNWNGGAFVSALLVPPDSSPAEQMRTYYYTPASDIDVRFCRADAAGDNWYIAIDSNDVYNRMAGKCINFLGDSYVANHNGTFEQTWEYKMCERNVCLARNYGINGNGIVSGNNPMVSRYTSMADYVDMVVVVGGKNDYNNQISIDSFKAGLITLITGLQAKYIEYGTKIVFFTPWKVYLDDAADPKSIKLQAYVDAMVEVCNQYSVPIFDSSRKSAVFMYDATFRASYCQGTSDISHLNPAGHDYFLPIAESFIRSIL